MDETIFIFQNFTKPENISVENSCTEFMLYLNTVVIGALCLLGLAGNTLSLLVLRKDRHNEVAVFLLQVLAVADNALLIVSFVILTIFVGLTSVPGPKETLEPAVPYLKKYLNPLGYMTKCMTVWTTVLLAINRFVAVYRPFAFNRFLTPLVAKIQVLVVFLFSVLLNVPRVFQYDVVVRTNALNVTETVSVVTHFGKDTLVEMVYFNIIYTTVILGAPVALIVCLNALLIRRLRLSMKNMRRNLTTYIGTQERNITTVMIIIIVEFFVCHTPDRIVNFLKLLAESETASGTWACPHSLFYASSISNVLIVFNSSSNFIVYFTFRERFRRILCEQLCTASGVYHCCCCCCRRWCCWRRFRCREPSTIDADGLNDRVLDICAESREMNNIKQLTKDSGQKRLSNVDST